MNLLTLENIKKLITTNYQDDIAIILTKNLKSSLIVVRGDIYEISDNVIYIKQHGNIDDKIITFISKYISDSVKILWKSNADEMIQLQEETKGGYKNIFKNSFIKSIMPQVKKYLTSNEIIFNKYIQEIHFYNGYMDLKDKIFKQRTLGKNYITKYINRDYEPSTKEQRNYIKKEYLNKIYSVQEDQDIILNIMSTAFAGLAQKEQKMTFLLGKGSSGKSTIINFSEASFGCYFKELDDNTFKEGNSKKDKIINTYLSDPQILLTVINEMKTSRIDKSLYKKFCDGKLQTTKLFLDESFDVIHNSSLICLANEIPEGDLFSDSGGIRRCVAYAHQSEFIDPSDEDKKNQIDNNKCFLMNKNLIKEFIEKGLLNAWCDIIFKRSYGLINEKIKIVYNSAFKDMKNLLTNTKNQLKDFVESNLHFDEDPKNRKVTIHKDAMLEKYKEETNDLKMTNEILLGKLKLEFNMQYEFSLRDKVNTGNSRKGAWTGVRFKTSEEKNEIIKNEGGLIVKNDTLNKQELFILTESEELNKIKKECEDLKKKLAEMELLLLKQNEIQDEVVVDTEDTEEIEYVEPKTESYIRDYQKDEEMEKLFNELF